MPHLLAHKASRRLSAVAKQKLKTGGANFSWNSLLDYHGHHTCARLNRWETLDGEVLHQNDTAVWSQAIIQIFIWHLRRSPIDVDGLHLVSPRKLRPFMSKYWRKEEHTKQTRNFNPGRACTTDTLLSPMALTNSDRSEVTLLLPTKRLGGRKNIQKDANKGKTSVTSESTSGKTK